MNIVPLAVAGSMGLVIAGIGLLLRRMRRADRISLARLRGGAPSRIADAVDGATIEIAGRARPTDRGITRVPISGRPALAWRLDVLSREGSASRYYTIYVEKELRDLLIDDGSGRAIAVLVPKQTGLLLDADVIGPEIGLISNDRYLGPVTEEHRRWLAQRLEREAPLLRDLRFEERVIDPEQQVTALGWARTDAAAADLKVTSVGTADGQELLLFTMHRAELVGRLRRGELLPWVFVGAGAAAIVLGLILAVTLA